MDTNQSTQISRKSFIQSFIILVVLILAAGILTRIIPSGSFSRLEQNGSTMILPGSYTPMDKPDYPIWRWFTAPVEVLAGPDSLTIITILLFLLMVGAAFSVLQHSQILASVITRIITLFGGKKYLLLWVVSLFFMIIGGFFGIFEEVIPLVPIMIALAIHLGWDSLTGLGMSILAVNMGFSTAITNPFTIGVAQKLAELPLFSGAALRLVFFVIIYLVFMLFLMSYARRVEKNPESSPVYREEESASMRGKQVTWKTGETDAGKLKRALIWFGAFTLLIAVVLFSAPFVAFLSSYSLPLVALLFFAGGLGAGFLSGTPAKKVWKAAWDGALGIAPGIPLILMASSIKFIVTESKVLDTLLMHASGWLNNTSPYSAALIIYGLALVIEFFIGSGSAKAFLLMPILVPLADLIGITRQSVITAFCFGDGFSNLIYPTNPVLLIALGMTVVSYPKWLKWSMRLWIWVLPVTILFLIFAVYIKFGPF